MEGNSGTPNKKHQNKERKYLKAFIRVAKSFNKGENVWTRAALNTTFWAPELQGDQQRIKEASVEGVLQ